MIWIEANKNAARFLSLKTRREPNFCARHEQIQRDKRGRNKPSTSIYLPFDVLFSTVIKIDIRARFIGLRWPLPGDERDTTVISREIYSLLALCSAILVLLRRCERQSSRKCVPPKAKSWNYGLYRRNVLRRKPHFMGDIPSSSLFTLFATQRYQFELTNNL